MKTRLAEPGRGPADPLFDAGDAALTGGAARIVEPVLKVDVAGAPAGAVIDLGLGSGARGDSGPVSVPHYVNSYLVKPVEFENFRGMMRDLGYYWLIWNQHP